MLKMTRGNCWLGELGDGYAVDPNRNCIFLKHIEPKDLGVDLGVLQDWEKVATWIRKVYLISLTFFQYSHPQLVNFLPNNFMPLNGLAIY
jgi:hypothetical protein